MKSFVIFCICCFFITITTIFSQENNADSLDRFNLKIGANLGVAAMSFGYMTVESYYNGGNGPTKFDYSAYPIAVDFLNEYSIFTVAKVSKNIGIGLEFGRLTHFESIPNVRSFFENGAEGATFSSFEFISGFYFSPFVRIGQVSIGASYMSPSTGSYFVKIPTYISGKSDYTYEELSPDTQKRLEDALQATISVYGRYDYELVNIIGIPVSLYGKLAFNLQDPIDYSTYKGIQVQSQNRVHVYNEMTKHLRAQLTIGISASFDAIK